MTARPLAAILCALGLVVAGCGSRQPEFTVWLNEQITDLSRAQVTAKIGSGEIDQDTLVWVSGKWMAFREHPSAVLLLAEAGPAAQRRARGTIPAGPTVPPAPVPAAAGANGPGAPSGAEASGAASAAGPRGPYAEDEVFKSLAFQGPAAARALLGEPDAVVNAGDRVTWLYRAAVVGRDGTMQNPELQFIEGRVRAVVFWPRPTMDDKIASARLTADWRPPAGTRQRQVTADEFFALVTGKTKTQILASLGEPTAKRILQGKEIWQYDDAVEEKGKRWIFAIRFEGDRAAEVQGM